MTFGNGEFMTYGNCKRCGVYDAIYLYGKIKGICGRCVVPTDKEILPTKKKQKKKGAKK